MQICFATHNQNKVEEIRRLFTKNMEVLSLDDLGIHQEIDESGTTLRENALIKAHYVFSRHKIICFADDSGLEVEALDGAPGVKSARYAGEPANNENNIDKLLQDLYGSKNRRARFKTIIALVNNQGENFFEGVAEGEITASRKGDKGFGYDPVFIPKNFDRTFAEMNLKEKNLISHRGKAVAKLIEFLSDNIKN